MRHHLTLVFVLLFCAHSLFAESKQPNIIFILVDDLGWKDIGCYGNDFVETPAIDKLAQEGLKFTNSYAAGAVCSPTRCAIQSGQNQARIGMTAHIPGHWRPFETVLTPLNKMTLPLDIVTVGESLQKAGYKTGYVGKWHLDSGRDFWPDKQGYEYTRYTKGMHLYGTYRCKSHKEIKPKEGQYRTDFEADLSIDFIKQNKDNPFFLMLSPFSVHIPLAAMSETFEKYKKKGKEKDQSLPHPLYAAMIEHLDDMVRRVVQAVEDENLSENTMIIFTSDNGGLFRRYDFREHADHTVSTQAPLRDEKGSLYEGGIRIPFIVKHPGAIEPNTTCDEPIISYDYYPTFVELAGGTLPENQTIDGKSLVSIFKAPDTKLERKQLHWHYPHFHHSRPASSILEGDWKLIEFLDGSDRIELYNLKDDIGEKTNLAETNVDKKDKLLKKLNNWRLSVGASRTLPNPAYDADRAHEWWSLWNGKIINSDERKMDPETEKDLVSK